MHTVKLRQRISPLSDIIVTRQRQNSCRDEIFGESVARVLGNGAYNPEFIRAFYGPGKYGGGGQLDAHDSSRFYYADEGRGTLEFKLDWEQGSAELVSVLYRRDPDGMTFTFRSAAPETAIDASVFPSS